MKIWILCVLLLGVSTQAADKYTCKYGREYYVQLPENFDPEKKYWLFVIVHGFKGNGKQMIGRVKNYNLSKECISVAPSFPWDPKMGGYYQMLGGNSDKQLLDIFKTLGEKYKLHDRMMLWGHSGGSQYTHRFAMQHHKYVLACASSSGGSWGNVERKAAYIPFAISCGEKDTKKSVSSSPLGRLDWYRSFRQQMIKSDMFFIDKVRPGEGHGAGPWCRTIADELFELSTTGLYPSQREVLEKELARVKSIVGNDKNKLKQELSRLRSLKFPQLKYSEVAVDDTDENQRQKYKKVANEFGFTTNKSAEKYLKERYEYYLKEVVEPQVLGK